MDKQPLQHLAIIPDGNRRWARQHGVMDTLNMYDAGREKMSEIVLHAFEQHISYVTLWVGSRSNLEGRANLQVRVLENIYIDKFNELAEHPTVHKEQVRIEVVGEWRGLVKNEVDTAIKRAIDATHQYDGRRQLTVLVGYDGRRERGAAVQSLLRENPHAPDDLQEADQLLRRHAWTGHLPDVDLVIRTGAWQDPHNSAAFLSLLTNESQYVYPRMLWPDFDAAEFDKVIDDYTARERRLGR